MEPENPQSIRPPYFPVSAAKFAVMSTVTFGLYYVYWFYEQWAAIKRRDGGRIEPLLRAIFGPFCLYLLLDDIQSSAKKLQIDPLPSPALMAAGWVVLVCILPYLPDPAWIFSLFGIFFLLPAQKAVNKINEAAAPGADKNDKFTGKNICAIIFGGIVLLLSLAGPFQ